MVGTPIVTCIFFRTIRVQWGGRVVAGRPQQCSHSPKPCRPFLGDPVKDR